MSVPSLNAYKFVDSPKVIESPQAAATVSLVRVPEVELPTIRKQVHEHDLEIAKQFDANTLTPPREFLAASYAAKAFVEALVGTPIERTAIFRAQADDTGNGIHVSSTGQVVIGAENVNPHAKKGDSFYWRIISSTLVHEYAHATGQGTIKRFAWLNHTASCMKPPPDLRE